MNIFTRKKSLTTRSNYNKIFYPDIGELGWSLYLSAHLRWIKNRHPEAESLVCCSPGRAALFKDVADICFLPKAFYEKFDVSMQNCFGIKNVNFESIINFFSDYVEAGYEVYGDFPYRIREYRDALKLPLCFQPYSVNPNFKKSGRRRILIFPRRRLAGFSSRNLPKEFYTKLINVLCNQFESKTITLIGEPNGTYEFNDEELTFPNVQNMISPEYSIQDLVDVCSESDMAVGGASAPPKITALQRIPTFIIGHEKKRCIKTENWSGTSIGFFKVRAKEYGNVDIDKCVRKVEAFSKKYIYT